MLAPNESTNHLRRVVQTQKNQKIANEVNPKQCATRGKELKVCRIYTQPWKNNGSQKQLQGYGLHKSSPQWQAQNSNDIEDQTLWPTSEPGEPALIQNHM
ncbi:hypothetical protein Dimus_037795 [Dionaea muscipula]